VIFPVVQIPDIIRRQVPGPVDDIELKRNEYYINSSLMYRSALKMNALHQKLKFQVLMRSQNLNEAQK
jgi:hypothetical protein